jgi:nitrite reductase/ring-hydroxylating ferredoxin subunit
MDVFLCMVIALFYHTRYALYMTYTIGTYSDLVQKKKLRVLIEKTYYLIALVGDQPYMIPDACPHQDASLYEGKLNQDCVTCPLHNATFNVVTGDIDDVSKMLYFDFGPEKITTHKVVIQDNQLIVDL